MTQSPSVETDRHDGLERARFGIWLLQYGPCWCRSMPSDSGSFDYVRLHKTVLDLSSLEENLFIVSERVIDGSSSVFRQVCKSVPEPKLVISAGPCPFASRFWDELPSGWTSIDEILPVDIHVADCISGHPEMLMTAVLEHVLTRDERRTGHSTHGKPELWISERVSGA